MSSYPSDIHEECFNLTLQVFELRLIASGFASTGNVLMARALFDIARSIENSQTNIKDSTREHINHVFNESHRVSKTILSAVLTGVAMGKQAKEVVIT